jgi:hypothetical protein
VGALVAVDELTDGFACVAGEVAWRVDEGTANPLEEAGALADDTDEVPRGRRRRLGDPRLGACDDGGAGAAVDPFAPHGQQHGYAEGEDGEGDDRVADLDGAPPCGGEGLGWLVGRCGGLGSHVVVVHLRHGPDDGIDHHEVGRGP